MRLPPAVLVPLLALPALVGCGGDDGPEEAAATTSASPATEQGAPTSAPRTATGSSTTSDSPGASGSPGAASPGQVPRPEPGTCAPVPESPDGRYDLGDARVVTLRTEGSGGLSVAVHSTGGWSTWAASTPLEAVVSFTRGEEKLDLEAETDGGRLVIRVCAGDG